jgi:hypothetical protein
MPRAALVREARAVKNRDAAIDEVGGIDPRAVVLVEDPALAGRRPGVPLDVPVDHRFDEIVMDVDAGEGGFLVLSELWHTGWRARVDGESAPIHRANGIFQVIELGPGPHAVRLRFRPLSWEIGRLVSAVTALGLVAVLVWNRRRVAQHAANSDSEPR